MNFHSVPRWQPWRNTEEAALIALRAEGKSCRYISELLGRSFQSVRHRASRLRGPSRQRQTPAPPQPTVTIAQSALLERVTSHDADHCDLIWPHRTPPKFAAVFIRERIEEPDA